MSGAQPSTADRIRGTLYGQAIGDALGLGTEGMSRDRVGTAYRRGYRYYDQMLHDDHRRRWRPGKWTDDTEQALCILESILERKTVDVRDIAVRFYRWMIDGGLGIGVTVRAVLSAPTFLEDPHATARAVWEASGRRVAANGAVMRTSPLGIWEWRDATAVRRNAEAVCLITHADPRCIASCAIVSDLIATMLRDGYDREVLIDRAASIAAEFGGELPAIVEQAHTQPVRSFALDEAETMGYTLKTLGAGLWALFQGESFEDALLEVVMEGGDADTNAAVAGALLGARFGADEIPARWINELHWKKYLVGAADRMIEAVGAG